MYGFNDFTTEFEEIHYSPPYIAELEGKIIMLENTNSELLQYKVQCDRLALELKHVNSLKKDYEDKYNEASIKLLCIECEDSFLFTETEQVRTLNQKCSVLINANKDLRKEIEDFKAVIHKLTEERDLYLQKMSHTQHKFPQRKTNKETNTEEIFTMNLKKAQIFNVNRTPDSNGYTFDLPNPKTVFSQTKTPEKPISVASTSPFFRIPTPNTAHSKKSTQQSTSRLSPKPFKPKYHPSFLRKSQKTLCT